jgi:hypothetical protein
MAGALILPSIAAVVLGGTAITGGSGGLFQNVIGALIITVLGVRMSIMGSILRTSRSSTGSSLSGDRRDGRSQQGINRQVAVGRESARSREERFK